MPCTERVPPLILRLVTRWRKAPLGSIVIGWFRRLSDKYTLIHLIFDNESLLSVGGFPSATSTGTDLAGVASTSGVQHVARADTIEDLDDAYTTAAGRDALSVVVANVEAVGPKSFVMDIGLLENRFQFERYLRDLNQE